MFKEQARIRTRRNLMNMHVEDSVAVAAPPARSAANAIEIQRVTKWFDTSSSEGLTVLKDVSLEVPTGSTIAIVGASGCGKSTLLNIASGLIKPDRGSVFINGIPAGQFNDWRSVGYMFQEDRLLPWRTTLDNVAFGLEAVGTPRAQRHKLAHETLQLVGLQEFSRAFPHQLSGGMRSRAALARSLVTGPQILLMDEPFSKLDPSIRAQMHDEILRIQQIRQMTILFVTHDVEEAVTLADRVIVLLPRPGRVREVVDITLERPRLITSHAFSEQVRQIRELI
jgi:NitT/TauT family transport system ATP-binding protein